MWILKSKNNESLFYVKADSVNVVGRNVGELSFPNDKSVSRRHATVRLGAGEVTVEDHGSKYGTYVNSGIQSQERIQLDIQVPLVEGSLVRFGLLGNEWSLIRLNYITCLSTIKEGDILAVREQLGRLEVTISKEWSKDCTHLTMPSITLTLKVVLALVHCRPIVKPEFWTECLRCRNNNLLLPLPSSFLPDVKESSISQQANFHEDERRKVLFSSKTFIFMSRQQMKNYDEIISSAGGCCCYLGDGSITHGRLSASDSVVIQHTAIYKSSQESQVLQGKINNITKYMMTKKRRIIPEVEIGLAILYVSLEKYCNPSFNFASVIVQDITVETPEENKILAPETQEVGTTPSLPSLPPKYIDETLSSSIIKSKLSISPFPSTSRSTSKRQASVSLDNTEPFAKRCNIDDKRKSSIHTDDDHLFRFVQDDLQPSTSKKELTLQSVKRKRQDAACNDENLFNFIPDTEKKIKPISDFVVQQYENKGRGDNNVLNIGKNMKRKCDSSGSMGGKRVSVTGATGTQSKSLNNVTLGETKYTCQKRLAGVIKDEADADTLEVITKLKQLDILPAVVIVNNDLIVKKDQTDAVSSSNVTGSKEGVKNFKKFVKVRPQRTCNKIVSVNMLVEYKPKGGSSIPEQLLEESSDEDDGSFTSLTFHRQQRVIRGRSRRL